MSDLLNLTVQNLLTKYVDSTFSAIPLINAMKANGRLSVVKSPGAYIEQPYLLREHSAITDLTPSAGRGALSLAFTDPTEKGRFDWGFWAAPVYLNKYEDLINQGDLAKAKVLEARLKQVMGKFRRSLEEALLLGTGDLGGSLQSLWGFSAAAGTGLLEADAVGAQGNSIGGLSKATFPVNFQNQVGTAGGAFATNGLRAMDQLMTRTELESDMGGTDLIMASEASYNLFRNELGKKERYTAEGANKMAGAGALSLQYGRATVAATKLLGGNGNIRAGGGSTTPISMMFLNTENLTLFIHGDANFTEEESTAPAENLARLWNITLMTQFVPADVKSHGVLLNAEA